MTDLSAKDRAPDTDRDYFMLRARQERDRADDATDIGVALTHRRMAEAYDERVKALSPA